MSFVGKPRLSTQYRGVSDLDGSLEFTGVFIVCMVRRSESSEDLPGAQPACPRGQGQRVMVVDDDECLLELTLHALLDGGYEPIGFGSALAALDAFRARPDDFALLLTDLHMPGMAGDILIREVRGVRPLLPVILISGGMSDAMPGDRSGELADEVLTKPLQVPALAASLKRLLPTA